MIQPDVAYIGYREFPHIDMYETGYRAARLVDAVSVYEAAQTQS